MALAQTVLRLLLETGIFLLCKPQTTHAINYHHLEWAGCPFPLHWVQGKFGGKKPALVLHPPQNLLNSCDKRGEKKKKKGQVRKPDLEQTEDSERATGASAHPVLLDSFRR